MTPCAASGTPARSCGSCTSTPPTGSPSRCASRLTGPTRDELAEWFPAAVAWARELQQTATAVGWELVTRRTRSGLATHDLPVAAIVPTPELALTMLGRDKAAAARRFATALEAAGRLGPEARQLALARPLDILGAGEDWPLLLELAAWVRDHPRPGIYPRQIPVAGVHTKVLEQHRPLLSRLLDVVLPIGSVDASTTAFAARYGFLAPARRARLRGDARLLGVPAEGTAPTWFGTWPLWLRSTPTTAKCPTCWSSRTRCLS